jgi:very-short-patch-repair endonuclease
MSLDIKRNFSELKLCKICNKTLFNLNGLSIHLKVRHKYELDEYLIKYELDNIEPLCKCGCGERVNFGQNSFHDYLTGHVSKTKKNAWCRNIGKSPINKVNFSENDIKDILNEFINNHIQLQKLEIKYKCSINPLRRIIDKNIGKEKRQEIAKFNNCWRRKYDPIINKRVREAAAKGAQGFSKKHNTHIELTMKKLLNEIKLRDKFIFQYRIKDYNTKNIFNFDFVDKYKKIIIECDGDYWHSNPLFYNNLNETQQHNKQRDVLKEEFCKKNGFKLYRFWENDFIKNIDKIKNNLLQIKQQYYGV